MFSKDHSDIDVKNRFEVLFYRQETSKIPVVVVHIILIAISITKIK